MTVQTAYDAIAPGFDRDRTLPDGVADTIRSAVLDAAGGPRPRLLDLGAGSGRIGWPFVAAGDDYVGADLSLGMLRAFAARSELRDTTPRLVQADGRRLPFRDCSFDAVMVIQVFGGMADWQPLLDEARRVLRRTGAILIGRTIAPEDGLDARMKRRLASILQERGAPPRDNAREQVERALAGAGQAGRRVVARWEAERSPRRFIERQRRGARLATLPAATRDAAMRELDAWARETFGSLDAAAREQHRFELQTFTFEGAAV